MMGRLNFIRRIEQKIKVGCKVPTMLQPVGDSVWVLDQCSVEY